MRRNVDLTRFSYSPSGIVTLLLYAICEGDCKTNMLTVLICRADRQHWGMPKVSQALDTFGGEVSEGRWGML